MKTKEVTETYLFEIGKFSKEGSRMDFIIHKLIDIVHEHKFEDIIEMKVYDGGQEIIVKGTYK